MKEFGRDLRFALRMLRKTPVVTAVAILSLALGIGGNSAIFSLVDAFLFSSYPYADADRLMLVWQFNRSNGRNTGVTPGNYFDWAERSSLASGWAAIDERSFNLTGDGVPERVIGSAVTTGFFDLLGVEPAQGRTFLPEEGYPGRDRSVILSHGLWSRRYGADPGMIGRTIRLNSQPYSLVGVMGKDFDFINGSEALWVPLALAERRQDRQDRALTAVARLAPGAGHQAFRDEMDSIAESLEKEHPDQNAGYRTRAETPHEYTIGEEDSLLVKLLMGGVFFVLLIACANIANLLLARGEERRQELAIRTALGARSGRLLRQLLTESILMAIVGGILGVVLSIWGIRFIASAMPPFFPQYVVPTLNTDVLIFTAALSVAAGLIFGLAPALIAVRSEIVDTLKEGGRGGTSGRGRGRLRSGLVVAQVTLALVLLCGAGLLIQTFAVLQGVDSGFEADNLLTVQLSRPPPQDSQTRSVNRFFEDLLRRIEEQPGVESASAINVLPRAFGSPRTQYSIDGQPPAEPGREPVTAWLAAAPNYFETMRIPVLQGRSFRPSDRDESEPVALVSRQFAQRYLKDLEPLEQRITIQGRSRRIVGLVGDVYQQRIISHQGAMPLVYLPQWQYAQSSLHLVVRTREEPSSLVDRVRQSVWAIDPDQPVGEALSMEEYIARQMAGPRVVADLVLMLGILALILSAVGLYGVIAYSVSLRQREIGIRMALGARNRAITSLFARKGWSLIAIGMLLALPGVWGVWQLLNSIFQQITGGFANAFAAPLLSVLLLLAVGMAASYFPARSASRLDPTTTLRDA
ncbi:MAG: ABC transporter permease [Acidobacteriota bacterium]